MIAAPGDAPAAVNPEPLPSDVSPRRLKRGLQRLVGLVAVAVVVVTLVAPDGHVIEHPDPMAMCRCGHSSNKPFCDGTHATIDFDGTLAN